MLIYHTDMIIFDKFWKWSECFFFHISQVQIQDTNNLQINNIPDYKNWWSDGQLSEILATLGITGSLIDAPLKPLEIHSNNEARGSRRAFNPSPIMPRGDSLFGGQCKQIQSHR